MSNVPRTGKCREGILSKSSTYKNSKHQGLLAENCQSFQVISALHQE